MPKSAARVRALALALFTSWLFGCGHGPSRETQEVILFSVVGAAPFSDSVYTINPDGSGRKQFLSPTRNTSYMYASGYNSAGPILVVAHKLLDANHAGEQLYTYHPSDHKWETVDTPRGSVGRAIYSPDHSKLIFSFAPDKSEFYKLYIKNIKTGEVRKLLFSNEKEREGYVGWRPDSKEIVFVGLSSSSGRLSTRLLLVSEEGGDPAVVMGSDDSPGGAAYSPDGQKLCVLTKHGVEELDLDRQSRRVILDWKRLPYQGYRYGSIGWSPRSNLIAFTILNNASKKSEIWTISPNSEDLRKVYT